MRRVLFIAWIAFTPTLGAAQSAEPEPDATRVSEEEARAHFILGQARYREGQFSEAAREFETAYALGPRATLLHNAFLAHRAAGELPQAAASLRRFLETSSEVSDADRSRLNEALRVLETEIEAAEAPAPPSEPEPQPIPEVAPTSEVNTVDITSPDETSGPWIGIEPGLVTLGFAAASLIVSLVESQVADAVIGRRDSMCMLGPDQLGCSRALDQEAYAREFALHRDVTYTTLGVGVGLAAASGVLLGLAIHAEESSVAPSATCGPTGCSISLRGFF